MKLVCLVFVLAIWVAAIVGLWRVFEKADEPGWCAIIPFVNTYKLFKITFGNGLLFLLTLIPVVGIVITVMMLYKLSEAFGHGVGMMFLLIFLRPAAYVIIGFSDDVYEIDE